MGTTRRLVITGAATIVVALITALALGGSQGADTSRALPAAEATTGEAEAPVAVPVEAPAIADAPAPPAPAARVAPPAAPAEVAPAAPAAPAAAADPAPVIPRNPVPIADATGPSISELRFLGCVFVARVSDPAGVGVVTLNWSGVPDPDFPGQWFVEPGSSRMWLADGDRYQGSRPRPHRGMVMTVTAVDRTLVGNRSQASMTVNFDNYPC